MRMTVLSLPLIPLTLAYAIVRYRLMDVDVIFRRGYAYTLATLCILAAFYAIVFTLGSLVQKNIKDLGNTGLVGVMLLTAFLFQPLRNWMQERLDKYFYRERYDYRLTLIEFARELNSEVDLDKMLASVADRLMQTLSIRQIGFFMAECCTPAVTVCANWWARTASACPISSSLDLSFLDWERTTPYLFFERTRYRLDALAQTLARHGAADHLRSGSHVLPPVHRARPDHRVHRRQPHRKRRLPFERRSGTADDALRLCRHRRWRMPLCTDRCSARWKTTSV